MILLMPGFAGLMLFKRMAVRRLSRKGLDSVKDLSSILMLSLVSSALYDVMIRIINCYSSRQYQTTFGKLVRSEMYQPIELILMIAIALILSTLLAAAENKKLIYKAARRLRITSHYGDDDVWTLINNSPDTSWVFVRDHTVDLVYFGVVEQYSDPGETRELLLSDVSVYSNTGDGEHLYDVAKLYVSRADDELTIEIPAFDSESSQGDMENNDAESGTEKASTRGKRKSWWPFRSKAASETADQTISTETEKMIRKAR